MARKDHVTKVESALIKAHRDRPEIETDSSWNINVMTEVRGLSRPQINDRDFRFEQLFVWRFAAATCMVALVVSIYAIWVGIGVEDLAAKFFIDDPLGLLTMRFFAL